MRASQSPALKQAVDETTAFLQESAETNSTNDEGGVERLCVARFNVLFVFAAVALAASFVADFVALSDDDNGTLAARQQALLIGTAATHIKASDVRNR